MLGGGRFRGTRVSKVGTRGFSMVGMLVPLKGGIGRIWGPPGSARTTSGIFPANWGMDCATDPTF